MPRATRQVSWTLPGAPLVLSDTIPWSLVLSLHAPRLALVAASAGLAAALHRAGFDVALAPAPFQIVGVALAILMAFRNSAAYDRWWEARKLWGGIVNAGRTWMRQIDAWSPDDDARRRALLRHVGWAHALAAALRGEDAPAAARAFTALPDGRANPAAWLMIEHGRELSGWTIPEDRLARLDATLHELVAMQGGCERIRGTPLPTAYRYFTRQFVRAYVVFLPWGLVDQHGIATVAIALAVSLVFLITEHVGRLLETPFTRGPYGLALTSITRNIEIEARQILGDPLPAPTAPERLAGLDNLL